MNIDQWLQLRREGRLAVMPLGMSVAMAACCDLNNVSNICGNGEAYPWSTFILDFRECEIFFGNGDPGCFDGNGFGKGSMYYKDGHGYGDGEYFGLGESYGDGECQDPMITQRFFKDKS